MDKEPTLAKVTHTGYWNAHFFEVGGEEVAVECSDAEYAALRAKGAGAPAGPGKYRHSSGRMRRFDTPSGFIGEGQYAEVDGKILVCVGGDQALVEPGEVVDGKLKVLPPRLASRGVTLAALAEAANAVEP